MTNITIELSYADAAKLLKAFNSGQLPSVIKDIELADKPSRKHAKRKAKRGAK